MSSTEMIPVQSVIFMCISLGIMIMVPLVYTVVEWIRKRASVSSFFLGIVGFLAGFCTYGILWCLYVVLVSGGFVTTDLTMSYYMVYAALAGIFPVFWMYFLRKRQEKKRKRSGEGMCFYAAFALANSVKLALPIVDNVRLTLLYNRLGLTDFEASMSEKASKLALEKLYQVSCKDSAYFLINGMESLLLLALFLAMGYLLDRAVRENRKKCKWLLVLLLVVFQMMTELPTQLVRTTSLETESKEVLLACTACLAVGIAVFLYCKQAEKEGKLGKNREKKEKKEKQKEKKIRKFGRKGKKTETEKPEAGEDL